MMLLFRTSPGRAELLDYPDHGPREVPKASGSFEAVMAAANLIAGRDGWRGANMHEIAMRDIREVEDKRAFDMLTERS
jgi:hypothetical protein